MEVIREATGGRGVDVAIETLGIQETFEHDANNAAMWTDPHVKNTCLFDPVGGSVSFYDTYVRLEPA